MDQFSQKFFLSLNPSLKLGESQKWHIFENLAYDSRQKGGLKVVKKKSIFLVVVGKFQRVSDLTNDEKIY